MRKLEIWNKSKNYWLELLLDDEDYDRVKRYYWYLDLGGNVRTHTANNLKSVYLSRFILGNYDRDIIIDHRDRDKTNNQKDNLRIANYSQNNQNRSIASNNTSGYKGVHFCRRERKYQARIYLGTYRKSLGYYTTPEEAAMAYDLAARKFFGEFAVLNFPNFPESLEK